MNKITKLYTHLEFIEIAEPGQPQKMYFVVLMKCSTATTQLPDVLMKSSIAVKKVAPKNQL